MIEVLKQAAENVSKAYDVLAFTHTERALELLAKTRTSLRQAIAKLESQEPVAWISPSGALYRTRYHAVANAEQLLTPLFTHPPQHTEQNFCPRCGKRTNDIHTCTPPQRTWVGLTDDEIIDVIHPLVMADMSDQATDYEIAKAIEAKLKQKNYVAQETDS
jgi:hypothetical protein